MLSRRTLIIMASIACFTACIGDFWITYVLGDYKPGYSQLRHTMSMLGMSDSPVSKIINTWWVLLGLLIIFFAIGFSKAFSYQKNYVKISTWLLILYGLGEGLGSGFFKANHSHSSLTQSGNIHEVMGAMGTLAILLLPLAMIKVMPRSANPGFYNLSWIVFIIGFLLLAMFILRLVPFKINEFFLYQGLWQRLFILDYYIYLITIAVIMIKRQQVKFKFPKI